MMGLAVREQAKLTKTFWYGNIEVTVALCGQDSTSSTCSAGPVTQDQRDSIAADLRALPDVVRVTYVSQQQAYQRAQVLFKGQPILASITPDLLPETYEVKLNDPKKFDVVSSAISGRPGRGLRRGRARQAAGRSSTCSAGCRSAPSRWPS